MFLCHKETNNILIDKIKIDIFLKIKICAVLNMLFLSVLSEFCQSVMGM